MRTLLPSELTSSELAVQAAKQEIAGAWDRYRQSAINHFRDGLEFGRACHQWQARYKAQGSRTGKGFEKLLAQLKIPKTTAYRWIKRYEMKHKLRADRHEVKSVATNGDNNSPTLIRGDKERSVFVFLLTEEEQREFRDDVKILGGEKKVTEMFLEFVAQKAFEKRNANGVGGKVRPHREEIRRLVLGA